MRVGTRYETRNERCGVVSDVICPRCGKSAMFQKGRNTTTASVMFIRARKDVNVAFVVCEECGSVFEINKDHMDMINSSENVLQAIKDCYQERKREVFDKYSNGFSEKNQTIAVILSAVLMTFGAPFFYIGKPLYGGLCLLAYFASSFILSRIDYKYGMPVMMALVYFGVIFAIFIGMGKIKDGNGRYIVSKKQRRKRSPSVDESGAEDVGYIRLVAADYAEKVEYR